jgi:integrase
VAYTMLLKRDKRSGIYRFRLQVPDDLRNAGLLGWEITRSLRTTSLAEAKRRYPAVLAWAQGQLDAARKALAHEQREVTEEELEDAYDASVTSAWRQWKYAEQHDGASGDPRLEPVDLADDPPEQFRRPFSSTPLAKLLRIDHPDQIDLAIAEQAFPQQLGRKGDKKKPGRTTVPAIFDAWCAERKPPRRTEYEWRRTIDFLARHLDHKDATELPAEEVTKAALVSWKAALLVEGRSGKTVKNRVDVLRALFNFAADNSLVPDGTTNPAKGLKVATKPDPASRRLPYSDEDARVILRASRSQHRGCLRWLPWLLLFTGARLDEVCQLTKDDVRQDPFLVRELGPEAGWYLDIHHGAPGEGRHLKNVGSARRVPLHQQVIEEGFLEFVAGLPDGSTLWPDLKPDSFGSRGGAFTKIGGRFARSLGITDKRKVLHSARHRFKDICRSAGILKDVHDALTGHVAGDVGSSYGLGHDLMTLRKAVDKLPYLDL